MKEGKLNVCYEKMKKKYFQYFLLLTISVLHFCAISESTNISPWQTRVWCPLVIPWKSHASQYLKKYTWNIHKYKHKFPRVFAINSAFVWRNSIFIDHLLLQNKRVSHFWAVYCNEESNKLEETKSNANFTNLCLMQINV